MAEILEGPEAIALGVQRLRSGGLVAFPTETVYGLGTDALDAQAVARVFALKGRPNSNPLIVHISDEGMAERVVADWTERAAKLAREFWPGPLTLVLPKANTIPDAVTAGGPTVAVRCPAHPVALALIEAFGGPIVGPSANPSGYISPTIPEHVRDAFDDQDLLVIDGGHCRAGIESTVLDLSGPTPTILRPGVIGAHRIGEALGCSVESRSTLEVGERAGSPGLIGAHYQPRTPTRCVGLSDLREAGSSVIVLSWSLDEHPAGGTFIKLPGSVEQYAHRMYAALNLGDRSAGSEIWVESPPRPADKDEQAIFDAVVERLSRAASN